MINDTLRTRLLPKQRKDQILQIAINLAEEIGYQNITRDVIAQRAGVAQSLITHYFKTMKNLRKIIMREAVASNTNSIIAQGLVAKDPIALQITDANKQKALQNFY